MTVAAMHTATERIETLYREDGERLWRALAAYAGDPEIASDAVAEAFAQALRRGDALRDPQPWVWRAGFKIAAGELKRRREPRPGLPPPVHHDPEADADLLDALAQLPPKQRAAVILFYYADAPVREIARRTGMTQLSVRANLSRGRQRLRQLLDETNG